MRLSFIVPIFNVAPYLRKCVYSLVHQDFSGYEIVLIDDGSTDESGKICDELSESISDERLVIRVLHQKNGGLSAARNAGLAVARGEYLCFVDSDDYWEENVLGRLMEQVKREDLDVLRFDYQNVRLVESRYEVFEPNKTMRYIDRYNEVVNGETYLNNRMGYACYAVMNIMRRGIVPTFTEGIHFEDVDWLPRMMLRAKRVNSTQTIVYNYFVRQGSITQTQGNKEKIRKNIEDRMKIIETYSCYIEQYPTCAWLKNMQSSMVIRVLTIVAQSFYPERRDYISQLKALNVYPLIIEDQGKKYVRRAMLLNIFGPRFYCFFMHMI